MKPTLRGDRPMVDGIKSRLSPLPDIMIAVTSL